MTLAGTLLFGGIYIGVLVLVLCPFRAGGRDDRLVARHRDDGAS